MSKKDRVTEKNKDIAIVGIACRFPGAENYNEFWNNLSDQLSSVIEVPADRWSIKDYYSPNIEDSNRSVSKWGGFIKDHDKFDAAMFKISPREAEFLDPQQRIMLELTRSCMEDACYQQAQFRGTSTAVYVGASTTDYKEIVERSLPTIEPHLSTGMHLSLIPNRVSYFYDLKGPCMMIDTACSSSLVAFNEAVNAIDRGDCTAAFVGAISVLSSPTYFISFSKTGMLSREGQCKTFDDSADGYVRGEGAAMMLIKPLHQAQKDKDNIHAVIKGVATNHGGSVSTITSPNPYAQSQVIVKAMENANLEPSQINYMEAHGTGTPKGDPIEIAGLKRAFSLMASKKGTKLENGVCGIGSVKTNIGHLEPVSGIAGMTKVIMAMKHKTLPGLKHFKKLNSRIKLDSSPFYIVDKNQPWLASSDGLRRAGVSSFGFGGVNGHIVLEEYPSNHTPKSVSLGALLPKPIVFVLSGKNKDALIRYAKLLADYITKSSEDGCVKFDLASFAYTLQIREAMEQRVAFEVQSLSQLLETLLAFSNNETIPGCVEGHIKRSEEPNRKKQSLAEFWVCGGEVKNWRKYHKKLALKSMPRKLQLPTYPFAKKRYWIEQTFHAGQMASKDQNLKKMSVEGAGFLHPLLHQNSSTLSGLRFTSVFSGQEHFLRDHVINGKKILPGVAYLEMARAAYELARGDASEQEHLELKNIVWLRPLVLLDETMPVHIEFDKAGDEFSSFRVYTNDDSMAKMIHAQGAVAVSKSKSLKKIPLHQLKEGMVLSQTPIDKYYQLFADMGFEYGPSHQAVQQVYRSSEGVLAKLTIPADVVETTGDFLLHPSLLDGALQAAIILSWDESGIDPRCNQILLPFSLNSLSISSNCKESSPQSTMWAWIRTSETDKSTGLLDIELCDEQGETSVSMRGFCARSIDKVEESKQAILLAKPVWNSLSDDFPGSVGAPIEHRVRHLSLLGFDPNCEIRSTQSLNQLQKLNSQRSDSTLVVHPTKDDISGRTHSSHQSEQFEVAALALFDIIKNELIGKTKNIGSKDRMLLQVVIPSEGAAQLLLGLSGLLRTTELESPKISTQLIVVPSGISANDLSKHLQTCSEHPQYTVYRVQKEQLEVSTYKEVEGLDKQALDVPYKEGGVYLITGGLGGLGRVFCQSIAQTLKKATIILTGRSPKRLDEVRDLTGICDGSIEVQYYAVDVCDKSAVDSLVHSVVNIHGGIDGIMHCAGSIKDNFIVKKSREEFAEVLSPKTSGLINLDLATSSLTLEFFVLFSSTSAALGNLGQSDYSTANAFMDAFAGYRNSLVEANDGPLRSGQTLAINWPFWKEGGMTINDTSMRLLEEKTGLVPLETVQGVASFYRALACGESQVMVMPGNRTKIQKKYLQTFVSGTKSLAAKKARTQDTADRSCLPVLEEFLLSLSAELLKLNVDELDSTTPLGDYGFDSIMLTEFSSRLNDRFNIEISPTVFFDYNTLSSLAEYLLAEHASVFDDLSVEDSDDVVKVPDSSITSPTTDTEQLLEQLNLTLLNIAAKLLKLDEDEFDIYTELSEYGFDSITLTEFASELNLQYEIDVSPTLFFDYSTIEDLSKFLIEEYSEQIARLSKNDSAESEIKRIETPIKSPIEIPLDDCACASFEQPILSCKCDEPELVVPEKSDQISSNEGIAIVGMSGCFPNAENIEAFWENLEQGKNCISEVPLQRWDWKALHGNPSEGGHTSDVKWGGFMEKIDAFDPLFFGISPREALFMDPQHRLLLTHTWAAIEDAGYAPSCLSGSNTGIFVGTGSTGYDAVISKSGQGIESNSAIGTVPSIGPNRTSFFFDFHGPSEPVESACSSSLVAMHKAVVAIQVGDCEQAIVGGINTIPNENLHISFNKSGMLSKDGSCKTFSEDANGYVRGEGVGILFLKKVDAAKRDGDHIYGVIRGSAQNHGGRANSLTAPNSIMQSAVLQQAYKKSGIDPKTVTYLEAHGTGTPLGDPIEINGIKTAFKALEEESSDSIETEHRCAVGSVKTNIGHLELAAGIAGVFKVLLQMKHKKIVKNLHFNQLNPHINLDGTPFYISKENHDWLALKDKNGRDIPRRAGVSSFGFGGANAHVVLEEYCDEQSLSTVPEPFASEITPVLILLSAKSEKNLKQYADSLRGFLRRDENVDLSLNNLAYTLQVGRDAMTVRLAIVTGSREELLVKLDAYLNGQDLEDSFYFGSAKENKEFIKSKRKDKNLGGTMRDCLSHGQYDQFVSLWTRGVDFDWLKYYSSMGETKLALKRISAPSYPFSQLRIWPTKKDLAEDKNDSLNQELEKNQVLEILKSLKEGSSSLDHAIKSLPAEKVG